MNRFVIADPSQCIGCNTCMAACAQAHEAQGFVEHPRLTLVRDNNATAPVLCRQCEDSPCATVCPVNAITHINQSVQINESTCIGCKLCGLACPFGAITPAACKPEGLPDMFEHAIESDRLGSRPASPLTMSPFLAWDIGVKTIAVKCDLCYFREQGPACVQACPTNALYLVSEASIERASQAKRRQAILQVQISQSATVNAVQRKGGASHE